MKSSYQHNIHKELNHTFWGIARNNNEAFKYSSKARRAIKLTKYTKEAKVNRIQKLVKYSRWSLGKFKPVLYIK